MPKTADELSLDGHSFTFVATLSPMRDGPGAYVTYRPQDRHAGAATVRLNPYGDDEFCKLRIPSDRRVAGVYAVLSGDRLLYIGEAASLSSRWNDGYGNISPRNCYVGGQETNCRINKLILGEARAGNGIELWFLPTVDRKPIELALRMKYRPPWNRI